MATNTTGRIKYLDAADSGSAIFAAGTSVRLDMVVVVAGSDAARLKLYADAAATAARLIFDSGNVLADDAEQFIFPSRDDVQPDSTNGLWAVLTGTSPLAWIWHG